MNDIIAPHGGQLIDRELHGEAAEEALIRAAAYPSVRLAGHTVSDLICIGTGVYSPLRGFMTRRDYWRVLDEMRLESGHVWSMPITLPVDPGVADGLREGQFVRLEDETGRIVGMMRVEDRFARDAIHEAKHVFRTQDEAHPGVARLYGESPVLIGGEIWLVTDREVTDTEITDPEAIDTAAIDTVAIDTVAIDTAAIDTAAISTGVVRREATGTGTTDPESSGPASIGAEIADSVDVLRRFVLRPAETRAEFRRRGWRRVVGFQTRNPVHRAHEYIQKCALETVDGLLLHPLIGETKADDVPARVRMSSYRALIEAYYPADRVLLAAFPAAMRYAGPREAVFHALCRKNYGCSHFIVGRDHAGVGNYYGTYDAQRIFDEFSPEELGIQPLFFEHAFYCHKCAGMATAGTCPHGSDDRVTLSGTKVREMLRAGEAPPPEFTRPEVAAVLMEALRETVQVGG